MRALPELFDVRIKARSIAYLFGAGAILGLLTLVFPHSDEVNDLALVLLASAAIVVAAVVWASGDHVRDWHIHVVLVSGVLIVSLANYYAGPSTLYPLLYMWASLYAFYFFRPIEAFAHMTVVAVSYAIVLAIQDPDSAIVRWLLAVGTPLLAGLLISSLLRRLSDRAQLLERSEARTRLVLDTAPDAFITLDRDGVILSWNAAADRLFGWTATEAIGKTMRSLVVPPEFGERHDERRLALVASDSPLATESFEVEFVRRDGSRFPGEATVSKVDIRGEVFVSGFITDVTERLRRQAEREALLREQAARAEAERVAELVGSLQALVDAALAHRTLDDILRELVAQVRGVLDADAATIYLADEEERLSVGAIDPGRDLRWRRVRGHRGGVARGDALPRRSSHRGRATDRRAAARGGRGHGCARGVRDAAARVRRRGPHAAAAGRGARGPRHRARARVRARAQDRGDPSAQPAARPPADAPGAGRGGALPARPPRRPRWAATGTT